MRSKGRWSGTSCAAGISGSVALAAITTKSTNLVLTLTDPATRPDAPLFSTVFDTLAVVLLAGPVVLGLRGSTRRAAA
ncbi:hypothetical protein AB0L62_14005 [Nocardia asteroides]|uniref:hypothetical protein n=1 Tax=Nocardia asteroides TaxID=1824 RepID=UPI00342FDA34